MSGKLERVIGRIDGSLHECRRFWMKAQAAQAATQGRWMRRIDALLDDRLDLMALRGATLAEGGAK